MVAGPVDVVEHLGNEQLIYVRLPGAIQPERVGRAGDPTGTGDSGGGDGGEGGMLATAAASTVRVPARVVVRPGDHVRLRVDVARLHLFDPVTTNRLT
jgi:ABC-type sugar transport system ATPase subunit